MKVRPSQGGADTVNQKIGDQATLKALIDTPLPLIGEPQLTSALKGLFQGDFLYRRFSKNLERSTEVLMSAYGYKRTFCQAVI